MKRLKRPFPTRIGMPNRIHQLLSTKLQTTCLLAHSAVVLLDPAIARQTMSLAVNSPHSAQVTGNVIVALQSHSTQVPHATVSSPSSSFQRESERCKEATWASFQQEIPAAGIRPPLPLRSRPSRCRTALRTKSSTWDLGARGEELSSRMI